MPSIFGRPETQPARDVGIAENRIKDYGGYKSIGLRERNKSERLLGGCPASSPCARKPARQADSLKLYFQPCDANWLQAVSGHVDALAGSAAAARLGRATKATTPRHHDVVPQSCELIAKET